jgi:hypothetical protein
MAVFMTPLTAMLFSRRPLTTQDEEAIRDIIKDYMQNLAEGVADVTASPEETVELSDESGRDALWKRGFEPTILHGESDFDLSSYSAWIEDTGRDASFVGCPNVGVEGAGDIYLAECKRFGVTPNWD